MNKPQNNFPRWGGLGGGISPYMQMLTLLSLSTLMYIYL